MKYFIVNVFQKLVLWQIFCFIVRALQYFYDREKEEKQKCIKLIWILVTQNLNIWFMWIIEENSILVNLLSPNWIKSGCYMSIWTFITSMYLRVEDRSGRILIIKLMLNLYVGDWLEIRVLSRHYIGNNLVSRLVHHVLSFDLWHASFEVCITLITSCINHCFWKRITYYCNI